jgi:sugar phosphate isomerase/epimerase
MIYTSTSCLKNPKNITKVLDEYQKAGIKQVELGSVHEYFDINELKRYDFEFLIHNYFPPPKKPFNLNLASQNKNILKKSKNLVKHAIELCGKIESPLYTFHAGFTIDPPKLGKPLPKDEFTERTIAIKTYVESIDEILDFSNSTGIKIAMEPNVVQKFNLVNGKNELCLFAEIDEIHKLFKLIKNDKLGILLDLGHTAVTSHWLNFDKDDFVEKCFKKVLAIHVSNNNGLADQHKSLDENCWHASKLKMFKHIPIILETMNLDINKIKENIKLATIKSEIKSYNNGEKN